MKKQTTSNQKGEINFRRKLIRQQIHGENLFEDEFDSEGIKKLLSRWMEETYDDMKGLKNTIISPYLEIGAERCQRSLVMENDIGTRGAAADISVDMLKTCDDYSRIFKKRKKPMKICCDLYNLPFAKDSLPFVFCYHTLHHFPDPAPIIDEVERVLSPGGCFFIGNEPYRKILHINLYKSKKRYSKGSFDANPAKKALDYFFSYGPCNETEHGIVENESITIKRWGDLLKSFDRQNVKIKSLRYIKANLFGIKGLRFFLAYLFGGSVSGAVYKRGSIKGRKSIENCIICPECRIKGEENATHNKKGRVTCRKCRTDYPEESGVTFLLTKDKLKELYPEISIKYDQR